MLVLRLFVIAISVTMSLGDQNTSEFTISDAGTQETTQFGTKINNTDSLTVGPRGPTLLEDFMLREKVMHFDHERIPERAVHARGVGAFGTFQSYQDWSNLTAAKFLHSTDEKTRVFVRFSTVLGSRGSPDTVRDVRGFATRFYTEEGNWDLVGNIIAPFFINDAIKFPDLIHAAKPEPEKEVPQAGTAHSTAYDFFSQHTETIHTVMWALSGRGIPRSFRQVEGFGVHTFRLINEKGESIFAKFHWKPLQGLSNLVWDEAQKIAGKDIDFHRNDLYTAIEKGDYPRYELGVQLVKEEDQYNFDFDLLDPTKIIPESLVPVTKLGVMELNESVENFFAETEQITFHPGHIIRGIGFTDDPLLQGRLFSYTDTQLNRMSTANYMQLPINRPLHHPHNNQRDGFMQFNIHKGRVAYYPNALQNNTPSVVSPKDGGYIEYPEKLNAAKQRGKQGRFNDHFSQAQLFYNSLTTAEQQQLVDGARFEIGKCDAFLVRQNMVNILNQVDNNLARRVAGAVGVKPPEKVVENKLQTSEGLSIENFKKPDHIRTKKVAILTAPGINETDAKSIYNYLDKNGAYVDYIGFHLGEDKGLNITQTYTTSSSVLYDGVYVPAGSSEAFASLTSTNSIFLYNEPSMFVLDAYRHGKPIAASGKEAQQFLEESRVPIYNDTTEQVKFGILTAEKNIEGNFKSALIKQRFWNRFPTDPDANPSPTKSMD